MGGTIQESTGLTTLGAREYDADTGRFISADPIIDYNDPQQINGYAYANNSPVTFHDATGLRLADCEGGWQECGPGLTTTPVTDTSGGTGGTTKGTTYTPAQAKADEARAKEDAAKKRAIAVAKELGAIIADELGITDALDCFTTGALGSCGATAVNVVTSLIGGGPLGRLVGKYGWRLDKAAAVGKRIVGLGKKLWDDFKDWRRSKKASERAEEAAETAGETCKINSFTGDTRVLMADGSTKKIKDVDIGDEVLASDPESGATRAETVTAEIKGEGTKHLVRITIDVDGKKGEKYASVTATYGHPFWAPELGEWVDATDLSVGQRLRTSAGINVQVTTVERWTGLDITVHNLTVADLHTYYVLAGATPVLVHNCNGRDPVNGGLDDDTYDRIDGAHGPDVADGVDYQVQRMHDGSSTAADHDLPGIGHDPDALASYFASWRGRMTHVDTRTGSRVAYDSSRGVLIVTTGRNIHGFRYSQGAFESGRYVTP